MARSRSFDGAGHGGAVSCFGQVGACFQGGGKTYSRTVMTLSWQIFRGVQFGLGFVEGDVGDVFLGEGEIDEALRGWVVAPGAYGVEVGEERGVQAGGE